MGMLAVETGKGIQETSDVLGLAVEAFDEFSGVELQEGLKDEVGADLAGGLPGFTAFALRGDIRGELAEVLNFGPLVDPLLESAFIPLMEVIVVEAGWPLAASQRVIWA